MRRRLILRLIAITAGLGLGLWYGAHRRAANTAAPGRTAQPNVEIQDGKTIDFSSGKPVVKEPTAREKAELEATAAAMREATRDVTFAPQPTTVPPDKAAATSKAETPPKK